MKKSSIFQEIKEIHNNIAWEWGGGINNGIYYHKDLNNYKGWIRQKIDKIWKQIIKNYLKKNPLDMVLLDGGCGNGQWIEYLGKTWGFKQLVGVDFSEEMLRAAKTRIENSLNVVWIIADLEDLSSLEGTFFDLIHLYGVVEHLDNPAIVISNCGELLNDQGILIVNVPMKRSLSYFSYMLFGLSPKYWDKSKKLKYFLDFRAKSTYYKYYDKKDVILWCKKANLSIVGTINASYNFGIFPAIIPLNILAHYNFKAVDVYDKICKILFLGKPAGRYFIIKKKNY